MLAKEKGCEGCVLQHLGAGFARTDGKGTSGVLVVAEALGEDEARAGKPLVGRAGQTWDRLVSRTTDPAMGRKLQRDDFTLANCINCRPPNNLLNKQPYEFAALDQCRPYLLDTIQRTKPRAILTLGNTPLRWFTGQWGIEQLRGYIFETQWGPVIPTYHPSYIMRGKWNLARVVQLDILKALEVARLGSAHFLRDKTYELSPSYQDVAEFLALWRAAGRPPLAFDIETPYSDAADNEEMTFEEDASYTILMVSLSFEPFKAISIPWQEPFITLLKEAFAEDAQFLVWNAKFDVPRLMAAGVHFGGEIIDVMLAWHWLEPALPMGLKYVSTFFCPDMHAWKLDMHRNFQWYNCADSDVLLRAFLGIQRRLADQGRWDKFLRHFVTYGKVLQKMSERGVNVDHEARKIAREHFAGRFSGVVDSAQNLAPKNILAVHPKRGYVRDPKETAGLVRITVELTPKEVERKELQLERAKEKAKEQRAKEARKEERAAKRAAKALAKAARTAKRRKLDK